MLEFTSYLTTREIASLIWIVLIIIFCSSVPSIRKSLLQVVKTVFQIPFIIVYSLMILYIKIQILAFSLIGVWENSLVKEIVIWTLGFALGSIVNINKVKQDEKFFINLLKESLKLTIFIEFFINFYTFPLIIELIFLPVLTFLFMMVAFSETDKKYSDVKKLINILVAIIGFSVLAFATYQFIGDYEGILSWNNLISFSLPIYLSITFIPFLYMLALFINSRLAVVPIR